MSCGEAGCPLDKSLLPDYGFSIVPACTHGLERRLLNVVSIEWFARGCKDVSVTMLGRNLCETFACHILFLVEK